MKAINATTIGNLISAHYEHNEKKFDSYVKFIIEAYEEQGEYFDVVKFFDDKWQFSYIENGSNKLAHSIEEAIMKNEWLK